MRLLGQLCMLGAFVGTGYAAFACVRGWLQDHRAIRRSGAAAGVLSVFSLSVALGTLVYGLLSDDFRFAYVAHYSNRILPRHYAFSSLWVGQAGSLLLWSWMSGVLALAFRFLPRREHSALREPTFGVLMGFCCFLVAAMVFAADPMERSIGTPQDGAGLSPLLQHPAMLIHPPIVFLGYAAWAIPFALVATALATGRLDTAWARDARPWALFAWIVLGSGILCGAQWAYEELGWGGYWAWDPVENGSLIPWLIGTASIHAMLAWRQRRILKKTACGLTIATFGACNFATFLTRSGIFSSLHAFSQSAIGWLFLGLMILMALGGGILITRRRASLTPDGRISTLLCRESMVVTNILALVSLAFFTCVGTLSTVISDAVMGRKIVMGIDFFNAALIPTGLVVLLTTALAPLLRWDAPPTRAQIKMLWVATAVAGTASIVASFTGVRHLISLVVVFLSFFATAVFAGALLLDACRQTSGASWIGLVRSVQSRRRQYAGFVVHMGLFCLAIGVTFSSLGTRRHEVIMDEGETLEWAGRQVRLARIIQRELPDKLVAEAHLEILNGSAAPQLLTPAQHFHIRQNEWTSEVSIQSTWREDFYTILHSGEGNGRVRLTFVSNPMMRWIWCGGWIMGIGALAGLWPARPVSPSRSTSPAQRSTTRMQRRQIVSEHACSALVSGAVLSLAEDAHLSKTDDSSGAEPFHVSATNTK